MEDEQNDNSSTNSIIDKRTDVRPTKTAHLIQTVNHYPILYTTPESRLAQMRTKEGINQDPSGVIQMKPL